MVGLGSTWILSLDQLCPNICKVDSTCNNKQIYVGCSLFRKHIFSLMFVVMGHMISHERFSIFGTPKFGHIMTRVSTSCNKTTYQSGRVQLLMWSAINMWHNIILGHTKSNN